MSENKNIVIDADKVGSIEQHDVRPIPESDRHGKPRDLFSMWIGANTNYVVLLTGALLITLGLSIKEAIAAVVIGNLLGCTVLGLSSIMGPKTGSAGIMTSRPAFGQLGSYLPVIISTISVLGWFSINSVVATEGLQEIFKTAGLPDTQILMWVSLAIILAGEILLAIYGHATILAAEKYISIVLGVLFVGLLLFILPQVDWSFPNSVPVGDGVTKPGMWILAMGVIFSYPISWANFASDYSRYFKKDTSWKEIAFYAGSGQFVALTLCEIIGVLFAAALGGTLSDPVQQLPALLPTWYLVPFLLAVIFGCVATNVPNGYTGGPRIAGASDTSFESQVGPCNRGLYACIPDRYVDLRRVLYGLPAVAVLHFDLDVPVGRSRRHGLFYEKRKLRVGRPDAVGRRGILV